VRCEEMVIYTVHIYYVAKQLPYVEAFKNWSKNINKKITTKRWMSKPIHCKNNYEIPGFFFDQTFLGLRLGKLFKARESLVMTSRLETGYR